MTTFVMDSGSGEVREETPLFLEDGGEEKLAVRRKELDVFVKLLKTAPYSILKKTQVFLNPCIEETELLRWWNDPATKVEVGVWLMNNDHKVNGKFGNWSNGFLGSRWADYKFNGKVCRIAFYSRKTDPHNFPDETERNNLNGKNYLLCFDPS